MYKFRSEHHLHAAFEEVRNSKFKFRSIKGPAGSLADWVGIGPHRELVIIEAKKSPKELNKALSQIIETENEYINNKISKSFPYLLGEFDFEKKIYGLVFDKTQTTKEDVFNIRRKVKQKFKNCKEFHLYLVEINEKTKKPKCELIKIDL
jgi:hypothetical protein